MKSQKRQTLLRYGPMQLIYLCESGKKKRVLSMCRHSDGAESQQKTLFLRLMNWQTTVKALSGRMTVSLCFVISLEKTRVRPKALLMFNIFVSVHSFSAEKCMLKISEAFSFHYICCFFLVQLHNIEVIYLNSEITSCSSPQPFASHYTGCISPHYIYEQN